MMAQPLDPALVVPEDVSIPVDDGSARKGWHWRSPDPAAVLLIAHGLGEHAGLYRSFAEYLVPAIGVDVLGLDFLGHGRSPGRRGHLRRYDQLIDDLLAATRWIARHRPGLPRYVLGHSNGGVLAIQTMLRDPGSADGLILSNPALQLKYKPPRHKLAAGHVLQTLAPWVTLSGPLPIEGLTRDPIQQQLLGNDRMVHTRLGPPLFFGMLDHGRDALTRSPRLRPPLLMLLGGADPIIDPDAGRSFFDRYGGPRKTLIDEPEMVHDPLLDLDRGAIYRRIADWILLQFSGASRADRVASAAATDTQE